MSDANGVTVAARERQLVIAAQKGDERAFEGLLEMHDRFIWKCSCKISRKHAERDDLVQVGRIAMFNAVRLFDVNRGVRLLTYAGCSVMRAMWRESNSTSVNPVASVDWLSDLMDFDVTDEDVDVESEANRRQLKCLVNSILGELPDRDRDILKRRMNGETLREVGEAWGICRERVRQIEKRAMLKVEERFRECPV